MLSPPQLLTRCATSAARSSAPKILSGESGAARGRRGGDRLDLDERDAGPTTNRYSERSTGGLTDLGNARGPQEGWS